MTHGDTEVRDALRWISDILDWSQIPFVVMGDLVKQMVNGEPIDVDKIEIAIQKNSWNATTQSLFKTFVPEVQFDNLNFVSNNVPVSLKIITRKYEFFKNPDVVFFWADEYKIPNPLGKYMKARYLVR